MPRIYLPSSLLLALVVSACSSDSESPTGAGGSGAAAATGVGANQPGLRSEVVIGARAGRHKNEIAADPLAAREPDSGRPPLALDRGESRIDADVHASAAMYASTLA